MKRIFLAVLLLLPVSAFANTWTIHAYADGYVIAQILIGIKTWMIGNSDFFVLTLTIAMLGMLGASVMGYMSNRPQTIATYIVSLAIGVYLAFNVTIDVVVQDEVAGPGYNVAPTMVQDVPAAVGLPIAIISQVGFWVGSQMETVFVEPNAAPGSAPTMSGGTPFGGSFGIMHDLATTRINNPVLRRNVGQYLRYCFIPYLSTGWFDLSSINKAPNFWKAIGQNTWQAVNQYVPIKLSTGLGNSNNKKVLLPCVLAPQNKIDNMGAWDVVNSQLTVAGINDGHIRGSGAWVAKRNSGTAAVIGQWATGAAQGATNLAINSAMISMTRGAYRQAALDLGADGLMVALNTENARRAQKAGWYTTAVLFRDMASYFFAILQCFVIALTPLVVLMAFIPGMGGKIMMGFGKVLLWLMLWWPGLAMVNFIMNTFYRSQMAAAGQACIGATAGCVASLGVVNAETGNMMIAAGLMATFVPAIMWGIVSQGSFALTSVLDRASGSGYATQAGEAIAHGSAKFGDISMNNANLNKHDTTFRNSGGVETSTFNEGAGQTLTHQQIGGTASSIAGVQNTTKRTIGHEAAVEKAISQKKSAGSAWETAETAAQTEVNQQVQSLLHDHAKVTANGITFDSKKSADRAMSLALAQAQLNQQAHEVGDTTSMSDETSHLIQTTLSGGLNVGASLGGSVGDKRAGLSGKTGATGSYTGTSQDSVKHSSGSTHSVGYKSTLSESEKQAYDQALKILDGNGKTVSNKTASQLSDKFSTGDNHNLSNKLEKSGKKSASYKEAIDYAESVKSNDKAGVTSTVGTGMGLDKALATRQKSIQFLEGANDKVEQGKDAVEAAGDVTQDEVASRLDEFGENAQQTPTDNINTAAVDAAGTHAKAQSQSNLEMAQQARMRKDSTTLNNAAATLANSGLSSLSNLPQQRAEAKQAYQDTQKAYDMLLGHDGRGESAASAYVELASRLPGGNELWQNYQSLNRDRVAGDLTQTEYASRMREEVYEPMQNAIDAGKFNGIEGTETNIKLLESGGAGGLVASGMKLGEAGAKLDAAKSRYEGVNSAYEAGQQLGVVQTDAATYHVIGTDGNGSAVFVNKADFESQYNDLQAEAKAQGGTVSHEQIRQLMEENAYTFDQYGMSQFDGQIQNSEQFVGELLTGDTNANGLDFGFYQNNQGLVDVNATGGSVYNYSGNINLSRQIGF